MRMKVNNVMMLLHQAVSHQFRVMCFMGHRGLITNMFSCMCLMCLMGLMLLVAHRVFLAHALHMVLMAQALFKFQPITTPHRGRKGDATSIQSLNTDCRAVTEKAMHISTR